MEAVAYKANKVTFYPWVRLRPGTEASRLAIKASSNRLLGLDVEAAQVHPNAAAAKLEVAVLGEQPGSWRMFAGTCKPNPIGPELESTYAQGVTTRGKSVG